MGGLKVESVKRTFKFKTLTLPDPNRLLNPEEVKASYALTHPELVNAKVIGPVLEGDVMEYTFQTSVGTKG